MFNSFRKQSLKTFFKPKHMNKRFILSDNIKICENNYLKKNDPIDNVLNNYLISFTLLGSGIGAYNCFDLDFLNVSIKKNDFRNIFMIYLETSFGGIIGAAFGFTIAVTTPITVPVFFVTFGFKYFVNLFSKKSD
jgi:hypothetical protein